MVIRASQSKRTKQGPEKRKIHAFLDNAVSKGSVYGHKIQILENRVIAGRSQRWCMPSQRYFATVCFKTCAILVPQSEKYSIHGTSLEVKPLIAELLIFIYLLLFIHIFTKEKNQHTEVMLSCCDLYHVRTDIILGHTTR